jgi:hypothetical protein
VSLGCPLREQRVWLGPAPRDLYTAFGTGYIQLFEERGGIVRGQIARHEFFPTARPVIRVAHSFHQ